ncbi:hypothetical protein Dimus_030677 [Dionaea muscipula]
MISPGVGENLVEEDAEAKEEGRLVVRKRRRLKKAAFEEDHAAEDSERTQSYEDVQGLASDLDFRSKLLGLGHPRGQEEGSPQLHLWMDMARKKDKKEIRRLQAENDRLKGELSTEKGRLIELANASLRLRADVEQVTKENQKVEEENEKLKVELEREKEKGKRSRKRIVTLHNDLFDNLLKNERLNTELNETYQKLTKV